MKYSLLITYLISCAAAHAAEVEQKIQHAQAGMQLEERRGWTGSTCISHLRPSIIKTDKGSEACVSSFKVLYDCRGKALASLYCEKMGPVFYDAAHDKELMCISEAKWDDEKCKEDTLVSLVDAQQCVQLRKSLKSKKTKERDEESMLKAVMSTHFVKGRVVPVGGYCSKDKTCAVLQSVYEPLFTIMDMSSGAVVKTLEFPRAHIEHSSVESDGTLLIQTAEGVITANHPEAAGTPRMLAGKFGGLARNKEGRCITLSKDWSPVREQVAIIDVMTGDVLARLAQDKISVDLIDLKQVAGKTMAAIISKKRQDDYPQLCSTLSVWDVDTQQLIAQEERVGDIHQVAICDAVTIFTTGQMAGERPTMSAWKITEGGE